MTTMEIENLVELGFNKFGIYVGAPKREEPVRESPAATVAVLPRNDLLEKFWFLAFIIFTIC